MPKLTAAVKTTFPMQLNTILFKIQTTVNGLLALILVYFVFLVNLCIFLTYICIIEKEGKILCLEQTAEHVKMRLCGIYLGAHQSEKIKFCYCFIIIGVDLSITYVYQLPHFFNKVKLRPTVNCTTSQRINLKSK